MSNLDLKEIITNSVVLKLVEPADYKTIYQTLSAGEVIELFGLKSTEEYSEAKAKLEKGITTYNRSFVYFYLTKKGSPKTIGWIGYHTFCTDHDRAEIGYYLMEEEYKGKGIMSEVMPHILDYGFEKMNLHRIEACVGPANEPSNKLMQKFGFTKEGLLREHYLRDGIYHDSLIYSLLRKEYLESK
jgi:ribosomal-protein-alanine N-acetyltransferase